MAKIIAEGKEQELPDGSHIISTCERLGVPLSCYAGLCGTCVITIEEGIENLEPKNETEIDMGLEDNQRLACQTRIRSGVVKISW